MHYRKMFDERFIGSWDLEGKESVVVTIADVKREELVTAQGTAKTHKPVVYMKGTDKGLVLNKTNCKTIADMYGPDVSKWVGKPLTLVKATVAAFGGQHECIRIKATKE